MYEVILCVQTCVYLCSADNYVLPKCGKPNENILCLYFAVDFFHLLVVAVFGFGQPTLVGQERAEEYSVEFGFFSGFALNTKILNFDLNLETASECSHSILVTVHLILRGGFVHGGKYSSQVQAPSRIDSELSQWICGENISPQDRCKTLPSIICLVKKPWHCLL